MDSIAIAYWKRPHIGLTIDYGQAPADAEIRAASQVCAALQIEHHVLRVDCSSVGSGDLASSAPLSLAPAPEWWPFRNQLLVTLGAARALALGVHRLLIGTVASDSAHADGRPAFVDTISRLLALQEGAMTVEAPAIELSAADLVKTSGIPYELLAWAHSCHVANFACGTCRGCAKHMITTRELGLDAY